MTDTSFFPSKRKGCSECCKRKLRSKDSDKLKVQYYHKAVICSNINEKVSLPIDIEMIRPGEGEVGCAMRMLERVFKTHSRFFDAIVGDAIYLEAPFFNFCRQHGKHVVAVLKENNSALLQDAKDIFKTIPPKIFRDGKRIIKYWDEEGFETSEKMNEPLRIIGTEETYYETKTVNGKKEKVKITSTWFWATTISKIEVPTEKLIKAAHKRWDIENRIFHTLGKYWGLNHFFKHEPTAILNFIITLFIAFVLAQTFFNRNLKDNNLKKYGLIALARMLYPGLPELKNRNFSKPREKRGHIIPREQSPPKK